jgi:hypothetical protein
MGPGGVCARSEVGGGVEAIVVRRFRTCALGGNGARDGRGDGEVNLRLQMVE